MGANPDPITPERETRARRLLSDRRSRVDSGDSFGDFFQWKRITEDVIHFTPFDNLPQDEQDAIRLRRFDAYKNSRVPWIVTDASQLLSAIDDVDDLSKVPGFVNDYAIAPARGLAKRFSGKQTKAADENLEAWRDACAAPSSPRERKRFLLSHGLLDVLAFAGLGALTALFPAWGFVLRAMQFLQVTDAFFGVGLQLGPALGFAEEKIARGLESVGLPFGPDHNKYHQLLAAHVTNASNTLPAAAGESHAEDTLTSMFALHRASQNDLLPMIVLANDDYPNLVDTITHPWQVGEYAFSFARLAASIPYNLGAGLINTTLGDMLANWSHALGVGGNPTVPAPQPGNELRALMGLADQGICPSPICDAQLYQDAFLLTHGHPRVDVATNRQRTLWEKAKDLGLDVSQAIQTLLGPII